MPFGRSKRTREPLTETELLDYAARSLGARMQSERDLCRKLRDRAEPGPDGAAAVDAVITKLKELRYISDERYAADFARLRQENRSLGRRRVQQDLQNKGIASPVIAEALETAYDGVDEVALVRQHMERKRMQPPTDDKSTARVLRRLTAAGFSSKAIFTVLRSCRSTVKIAGRTRDEIAEWLIATAQQDPALVVGFDFCFSFPAWFLREVGAQTAPAFWQIVAERGEQWLHTSSEDRRFWGKPHKRPAEFSGALLHRMLRGTDIDCKIIAHIPEEERALRVKGITPKSVFQIGGSGSVGTASLRGMPILARLRGAGFRVWPFDRPRPGEPLVVEMYSRLNTGPVHKSNPEKRAAYLKRKKREDAAWAAVGTAALKAARASEDAFDALASAVVMAERRDGFYTLPEPRDPNAALEGWTWAPDVG